MAKKSSLTTPKRLQNLVEVAPDRFKNGPKRCQKDPNVARKVTPKHRRIGPKSPHSGPKTGQKLVNATTKNTHKSLFWSSKVHRNGKNSTLDAFRCTSLLHTFVGAGALLQIPPLPQHPLRNPLLAPVPAPIPASAAAPRGPPSPN